MDSGGNLNCWFKSVFFVLGYPEIFDLFKSYKDFVKPDNDLYKTLSTIISKNTVYSLKTYKHDEKKYYKVNYNIFCKILSEPDVLRKSVFGSTEFNISLYNSITCQDLPYFELYVIYFLKNGCGLKVLDLLYLESSRQNEYDDDVYYFFHKFYNYNDRLIFSDEKKKIKIAQQTFTETDQEKDNKKFDIVVVSHHKYNSKLTRYFTELSKVRDNNLLKYSNKTSGYQPKNINKKLLLLNISHDYKDPPRYYSETEKLKTIVKSTHICGTDIDLNKEFLLFGCLLRNNNTTYTRTDDGKIKKGKTKTIFAYLTYDTPEYKYEIKADDPITPVTVSYTIKSQHYIDDTRFDGSQIVDFKWITELCRFANKTFIITENGIDYEYNFATGDKLLLYMNVFNLINNKLSEIQSDIARKFPDYRIPNTTINNLDLVRGVTYNLETEITDSTSKSSRSSRNSRSSISDSSKSRKTTARNYSPNNSPNYSPNYSPNNNSRSTNSRSRSISN